MTLAELKESIRNKNINDDLIVFVCEENFYLATQYINAICETKQLELTVVQSIFSSDSALSLVMNFDNNFKVVYVDTFEEITEDYSRFTNTAVVCNKVSNKLANVLAPYIVKVPSLQEWQVKDFMQTRCPSLSTMDINDLYSAAGGNIFKITSYLDLLDLFEPEKQSELAYHFARLPGSKLVSFSAFALVDAIVSKDLKTLKQYFSLAEYDTVSFLGLVSLLLNKVKAILYVEHSTKPWQELNMSESQYYRLSKYRTNLKQGILKEKLKILTSLELQLKSGLLDIKESKQIDYLILKLVV